MTSDPAVGSGDWLDGGDLRTRSGRRKEILNQVKAEGGFGTFWVSENQLRAIVATEMFASGELVEDKKKSQYPWHSLKINFPVSNRKTNHNRKKLK